MYDNNTSLCKYKKCAKILGGSGNYVIGALLKFHNLILGVHLPYSAVWHIPGFETFEFQNFFIYSTS